LFKDPSGRYDALRFLAGDAALPDASNTAEVQQYLGDFHVAFTHISWYMLLFTIW